MAFDQYQFSFYPRPRGCYLVTDEVLRNMPQLRDFKAGRVNLSLQHTSAALSINDSDPAVRDYLNASFDHTLSDEDEGVFMLDETLANTSSPTKPLFCASLDIPIYDGKLGLSTRQGIYLMEFGPYTNTRYCVVTIQGSLK